ncbi:hypothetical protein CKO09_06175 [Chromatium weissei]|nr:hypothetical protein [Chromatium weissei]
MIELVTLAQFSMIQFSVVSFQLSVTTAFPSGHRKRPIHPPAVVNLYDSSMCATISGAFRVCPVQKWMLPT